MYRDQTGAKTDFDTAPEGLLNQRFYLVFQSVGFIDRVMNPFVQHTAIAVCAECLGVPSLQRSASFAFKKAIFFCLPDLRNFCAAVVK